MNKTILAALVSAAFLGACGGGGGSTDNSTNDNPPQTQNPAPVQAGTSSGILTDGPVAGVQYTTSGGYSGVTGADGSYAYNPGETVTFKIGAITLGTVTATGTVTPLDLAAAATNKENVATNLLVLLQSLDADGDASNGIAINDATKSAAASASAIDLTQAPASFASSSNSALTSVMNSAGLPKTAPVSETQALAHFKEEFFKKLAGGWTAVEGSSAITLRFDTSGNYIIGEVGTAEFGGQSGTEVGRIDWNPKTGEISLVADSIVHDSNGEWGLSHNNGSTVFKVDGDKLVVTDDIDTVSFERVANDPASLVGTWAIDSTATMNTQNFTFFENGKYLMADPLGDTEYNSTDDPKCGEGGVEYGTYTYNATTGVLAVSSAPEVDTNGCAGAWDKPANSGLSATITFNTDKSSFTLEGTTFHRVSK
jgi:hypothetical protein